MTDEDVASHLEKLAEIKRLYIGSEKDGLIYQYLRERAIKYALMNNGAALLSKITYQWLKPEKKVREDFLLTQLRPALLNVVDIDYKKMSEA